MGAVARAMRMRVAVHFMMKLGLGEFVGQLRVRAEVSFDFEDY